MHFYGNLYLISDIMIDKANRNFYKELIQKAGTETELVYGKGHRKAQIQRDYETFLGYYARLVEYEYWLDVIGDNRKSCTKTDHDATMSALKIDYYNNSGIKTPAYNVQIGVSDGVIMNAGVFRNPGDTTTFTDFMDRHYAHYGEYPLYPMADAGYGGLRNYLFCLMKGMNPVMKYNMYAKKNERKYKKTSITQQTGKLMRMVIRSVLMAMSSVSS